MSEFDPALALVLHNEGGLSDNPADPGGITNFGISLRFLRMLSPENLKKYGIFDAEVTEQTIRDLSMDVVKRIYFGEFWLPNRVYEIDNQRLANYLFDCIINPNPNQGIKFLQQAIAWETIKIDGILGSQTIAAANGCNDDDLVVGMKSARACWYTQNANKLFLDGLLRRTWNESSN